MTTEQEALRMARSWRQRRAMDVERLVVLSCPWEHHHLWPADLEPYPRECMAKVASLPDGEWPTCGKHLHASRYVTGEQNGSTSP